MSNELAEVDVVRKRRVARQREEEHRQRRLQRTRQRLCFWTRPFGHKYEDVTPITSCYGTCVGCGKAKWICADA